MNDTLEDKLVETAIITLIDGTKIDILNPDPECIKIEDIALSLSHICRFNGHCRFFFGVSCHSLNVCQCIENAGYEKDIALAGLLHDASENLVGDCVTPFKTYLGHKFKDVENNIQKIINKKYNIDLFTNKKIIKKYDDEMYELEKRCLKEDWNHPWIQEISHRESRLRFLDKFHYLSQ